MDIISPSIISPKVSPTHESSELGFNELYAEKDNIENHVIENCTSYSSMKHLDAPSLEHLSTFLELYSLSKTNSLSKSTDQVPGASNWSKGRASTVPKKAPKDIMERTDQLIKSMQLLDAASNQLATDLTDAIELI